MACVTHYEYQTIRNSEIVVPGFGVPPLRYPQQCSCGAVLRDIDAGDELVHCGQCGEMYVHVGYGVWMRRQEAEDMEK